MSLLNVSELSFRYLSTVELFRDVTFAINSGDSLAIVGPNGAGKSTLLRIIAGELEPTRGAVARGKGLRTAQVLQQIDDTAAANLFEFVFDVRPQLGVLRRRVRQIGADPGEYANAVSDYEAGGGYAAEAETERILAGLGFTSAEFDLPLGRLSGGQRTRAALARGLNSDAELLLLDEPTNHLDIAAREWLEDQLARRRGACVFVSHDRTLLRRLATRVLEIERGMVRIFEGGYDDYRARRALLERQAWENYDAQQRRRAAAQQAAERRSRLAVQVAAAPAGVKGSRDFYGRKAAKVARTGRILRERVTRESQAAKPWQEEPIPVLDFAHVRRSGDIALAVTGLSKSYGGKRLFENLTFYLSRGERLAIAGPNGSGKTTLLRILCGIEQPDAGQVQLGANVELGYAAQDSDNLPLDRTPLEVCGSGTLARTLLGCLKVRPDRIADPLCNLSAGERAKVALVRLLVSGANLLLLDEPTNHLEIEAQEALEQTLAQFPGTIVIVSHDRSFLDALGPELQVVDLSRSLSP
jgi:ATP-binding cassette, subfamily F, member 3